MLYSYYYTLDEFMAEPPPPFGFSGFVSLFTETLWNMGEAIWRVDEDDD